MKPQVTKYGPGTFEVEFMPADSNVGTTFQMLHEGPGVWSVRCEAAFYMQFKNRLDCMNFIQSVTRAEYPNMFQD